MILKILKILTVLSFLLITFDTGHIGGQFGSFILLGFLSDYKGIMASTLITIILIYFIVSSIKFLKPKVDFYLSLLGGLLLFIPITIHIKFLLSKDRSDSIFYFTTIIFLVFYGFNLYKILKQKNLVIK